LFVYGDKTPVGAFTDDARATTDAYGRFHVSVIVAHSCSLICLVAYATAVWSPGGTSNRRSTRSPTKSTPCCRPRCQRRASFLLRGADGIPLAPDQRTGVEWPYLAWRFRSVIRTQCVWRTSASHRSCQAQRWKRP